MQQTADAVANVTKDQAVDADAETILVSGLSYFSYSAVETAGVLTVVDAAATIAAYGLSSCCSSVVALATTEVAADADVDATTVASKPNSLPKSFCLNGGSFSRYTQAPFIIPNIFSYIFSTLHFWRQYE